MAAIGGVRLALVGAGDIGRRHIGALAQVPGVSLAAIVEPGPSGAAIAAQAGVPLFGDFDAMLRERRPDGVIIATPNSTHVPLALAAIAAGVPALVEKPIADGVAGGLAIAEASEAAGVPVLVGHHRRHSGLVREARRLVRSGALGAVTAVQGAFLVRKPDEYYQLAWRRSAGGGPLLINMIHDIDSLRFIVGEIEAVQGVVSSRRRGHAVEDSAAAILHFANGALGTFILSDATPSPWSWELTAGEQSSYSYPRHMEDCYRITGTHGALGVPTLRLWQLDPPAGWRDAMREAQFTPETVDPAVRQLEHFAEVVRGTAEPVIGARDGARTLAVTLAVAEAARRGGMVRLPQQG